MLGLPLLRIFSFSGLLLMAACSPPTVVSEQDSANAELVDLEAREDSLALLLAYQNQTKIESVVYPDAETNLVRAKTEEDAADDPAIWVNENDPDRSLIIGSNKRGGIATYGLNGKELAYYPVGNINNIDVVYKVKFGEATYDLLGGSNRSDQSIDLFKIDPATQQLVDISARPFFMDTTLMDDIYGFCFYQNPQNGLTYAFANAKNGHLQQYLLIEGKKGLVDLQLVRELTFDSQVEGMVADHHNGYLYLGEENRGVWKLSAEPRGTPDRHLIAMSDTANPQIVYDIEGIALYSKDDAGYLLVSSQGNFSYAVFDREGNNAYITSFKIMEGNGIDGVEETDGIEVASAPIGALFPQGLFVTQDGFNYDGDSLVAQNFKLVRWEKIEALIMEKK